MDKTDERILNLMQGNARMTHKELGDVLGVSRVAALKRVQKLERAGVIRQYNTYICRDDEITMMIDIVTTPEAYEDVMNYCLNQTAYVRQIFRTTKENHIHMVAVWTSADELEYLVDKIRKDCGDQIVEIESHAVTEVIKDVYGKIRLERWTAPEEEVAVESANGAVESVNEADEHSEEEEPPEVQCYSGGKSMFKVNEKNSRIIVMINKELGDLTVEDIRRQNDGHFRYTVSMSRQFLDQDIHDLDLSVRSYNCLKRAGITTVGDLVNQIDSGSDLLQIRNLGQTSASEIMLCLFLNNYMFLKPEKRKGYLERVLKMNGIERQD